MVIAEMHSMTYMVVMRVALLLLQTFEVAIRFYLHIQRHIQKPRGPHDVVLVGGGIHLVNGIYLALARVPSASNGLVSGTTRRMSR